MNYRKWKALLEEKKSNDYKFIVEKSPSEINISILDNTTNKPVEGKPNQYGESSGNAHMKLLKRGEEGNWEVASVASPKGSSGVGKELYLLALELTSRSGLSPDSVDISPAAKSLWNDFLKNHPDVSISEKKSELDTPADDPYKYIWRIEPEFESSLDISYKKAEKSESMGFDVEEIEPFDADEDIEDYLEDIYEEVQPQKDSDRVTKVIISDENGKILVLKRADSDENWDLPGGHVEKGEEWEDGAKRETKEETNLDVSNLKYLNSHEKIKFYVCKKPTGDISLQKEEHTDFKWVSPNEIDALDMRQHQKDAIKASAAPVKEDFQQDVKKNYSKLKFKMIGQGKNKYNIGGKMKKPSYKRSKSAPPGFGGSLE